MIRTAGPLPASPAPELQQAITHIRCVLSLQAERARTVDEASAALFDFAIEEANAEHDADERGDVLALVVGAHQVERVQARLWEHALQRCCDFTATSTDRRSARV